MNVQQEELESDLFCLPLLPKSVNWQDEMFSSIQSTSCLCIPCEQALLVSMWLASVKTTHLNSEVSQIKKYIGQHSMWVSLRTRGSGDPSSGCICNTAGSDVSVIEPPSLCQNAIHRVVFSLKVHEHRAVLITHWTMVTSIRLQQLAAVAETDCWRRQSRVSHTAAAAAASPAGSADGGELSCCSASALHCTVLYLQSWCGCRWADPWLSSSGSPAGTLHDLHAPAAPCQRRTGGTM